MAIPVIEAERCAVFAIAFPPSHSGKVSATLFARCRASLTFADTHSSAPAGFAVVTPRPVTAYGDQSYCFKRAQMGTRS